MTLDATTYMCLTLDTQRILRRTQASAGPQTSSTIEDDELFVCFSNGPLAQGSPEIAVEGTRNVHISAKSASNQFEDDVELRSVQHIDGEQVVAQAHARTESRPSIAPCSPLEVLPGRVTQQQFTFVEARVVGDGPQTLQLQFAIYQRNDSGNPQLAGTYDWVTQMHFVPHHTPNTGNERKETQPL